MPEEDVATAEAGVTFQPEAVGVVSLGLCRVAAGWEERHRCLTLGRHTDCSEVLGVEDGLVRLAAAIVAEVASKSGNDGGAHLRRVPPRKGSLPDPFPIAEYEPL